jgi:hypothetical protein
MRIVATSTVSPPVLELLRWVSGNSRTYAEAMEAWKTHCPRSSAWEDALEAGLVAVVRNGEPLGSTVTLTDAGKAALDVDR